MQVFVYEYTGEYCIGGYVCVAENKENAEKLLTEIKQKYDKGFNDFEENTFGYLRLEHVLPTSATKEEILLSSYDCC